MFSNALKSSAFWESSPHLLPPWHPAPALPYCTLLFCVCLHMAPTCIVCKLHKDKNRDYFIIVSGPSAFCILSAYMNARWMSNNIIDELSQVLEYPSVEFCFLLLPGVGRDQHVVNGFFQPLPRMCQPLTSSALPILSFKSLYRRTLPPQWALSWLPLWKLRLCPVCSLFCFIFL